MGKCDGMCGVACALGVYGFVKREFQLFDFRVSFVILISHGK